LSAGHKYAQVSKLYDLFYGFIIYYQLASRWFPSDGHGFRFTYVSIEFLTDLVELKLLSL